MSEPAPIQQDISFAKTPLQVALYWAEIGFPVFPCGPDKKPLTPHGFKDATADFDAVADFWRKSPNALVGIPTGEASGLYVVDLDTDRKTGVAVGEVSFAGLGLDHLIKAVPTVATPSGGLHLYFRDSGLASTAGKLGPKVDTRGNGGYIIAPGSVSPAGSYRLLTGSFTPDVLQHPPDIILEALQAPPGPPRLHSRSQIDMAPRFDSKGDGERAGMAEVEELLSHIPPDCGYSDWNAVLMGLHDHFDGAAMALDLADNWSAGGAKYRPGVVAAKWRGFQTGRGIGLGTVCSLARQNGADLGEIAKRHKSRQEVTYPSSSMSPVGFIADLEQVDVGKRRGRTRWCADIACTILETDAVWNGVLAYDEFTKLYMLLKPIPGTKTPRSTFTPRPMVDTDTTAAVRWFNRKGFPDARKDGTADALELVAMQNIISPVRNFLESLSWDGKPRVADWLTAYCGADPTDLTAKVGRAWLVSAVARALKPGCKADCALVLEGKQGAGKSSILRALAGEWFHDGLSNLHDKDASASLRGKWIIELPELSAMRRSDTEAVKAFLSRTEERYRPAYGRAEVIEPRRCVFAGTTNRSDYLTDDTGGRRFWPVVVGAVKLDALTGDREQIWAETVALYRAGESWWLDRTDEWAAAAVVATRAADDPWMADVMRVVDGLSEVSTRDVFQLLGIGLERQSKADAMRITGILTRAGWTREGKFTGGESRNLSRYAAPLGAGHD